MAKRSERIYTKYSEELKKALLQDDIKFLKVYGDNDACVEYKRIEYGHLTNADRIRAMTDEGLAECIHLHIDCEQTCPCFDACHKEYEGEAEKYFIYTPCEQKLLEWLKQEVKDG